MTPSLDLWQMLCTPLIRLIVGLSLGIFIANILEALHWTQYLAKLSAPFAKRAHFGVVSQAAFATAFLSPSASNAILAEAYAEKRLKHRELVCISLFASFPAYLVHIPTLFFLLVPVLGFAAVLYVAISLFAALLRTLAVFVVAQHLLPAVQDEQTNVPKQTVGFVHAVRQAWKRLCIRFPRMLVWTVPVYIALFFCQVQGVFAAIEASLADNIVFTHILSPQVIGIVMLHMVAELGAAVSASASLLSLGSVSTTDIIGALLIGNMLSTPIRALRHQLPSYVGLFEPALGVRLVFLNQLVRLLSMAVVTVIFFCLVLWGNV
ncbi:MAG: hypothetical protein IJS54_03350 [Desulfovibrio sp.]|nr:hypothetical protein [Desulfovibrio sp.]